MTGSIHAKFEIEELIEFNKLGFKLISMIALGVSKEDIPSKLNRKSLEEVVTFID